jgi:hypothetical protein
MTLTLPTIVPAGYAGTSADFNFCKVDRSGALRVVRFKVSVPSGTTTAPTALIGLMPFQKGCRVHLNQSFVAANTALDTGSTITVDCGYTYYDSTLGTSADNAFVDAATTWQSSALTALTLINGPETVGHFTAATPGWITIGLDAGPTTTTGDIFGAFTISYDQDISV